MAIDTLHPILLEPNSAPAQPELLISAVLHLMSHYTANLHETRECTRLAAVIERHLKALAELPELAPVLRATCRQLAEQWAAIVDRSMPRPQSLPFLARFAARPGAG